MTTDVHTGAVVDQEWQRLDRRSIWVAPLRPLAGLLFTGLLVITFRGWEKLGVVEPLIGVVVTVGAFALSAWYWATTRYRITPTHVEMNSGILVRKHRAVARDRLRTVDFTADITHRIAGLAVVAIGTGRQGGDADDEVKLDSVARAEAERLREMLLVRKGRSEVLPEAGTAVEGPAATDSGTLATYQSSWLRLAPFSLLGLVAVGLLLAAAGQTLRTVGGDEVFTSGPARELWRWVTETPVLTTVLVALAVLVVLNTVLSTVLYALVYGGYTLRRVDDGTLRISYGLVTHRSVTIEERRIRGVRMDEPLLLRLGGGARLKVVAAGLGAKDGKGEEKQDSDMLLPTAPRAVADSVTAGVLRTAAAPPTRGVRSHPVAALRVLLVRWVGVALIPAVVLAVLASLDILPAWIWQLTLLLAVPAALFAWLEYRNLGHRLVDDAGSGAFLVARGGSAVRHTVTVRTDGIIAWRFHRTVLQGRSGLLSVTAAVAAGKGAHTIEYAAQQDALSVARDAVPGLLEPFLEPDVRQV